MYLALVEFCVVFIPVAALALWSLAHPTETTAVEIRGLPWEVATNEVSKAADAVQVTPVAMCPVGGRTGTLMVMLENKRDCDAVVHTLREMNITSIVPTSPKFLH
eukprot:m51a1_g12487 hypothetical protein (105) ;mRNA; r:528-842